MFGKLEDTSRINTTGIGLGLSICKTIVEMFEGRIYLDTEYQDGTKFNFEMKARDEEYEREGEYQLDSNNNTLRRGSEEVESLIEIRIT